ncbi:MAG: DUF6263 family protein [Armatimonadota bacterium]|nr:DUF6263 family protein [Armatimonadota bacterium]
MSKNKILSGMLVLFSMGLATVSARAEGTVLLRHHWTKGTTFRLQLTVMQKVDQAIPQRPIHIDQTTGIGFTYAVLGVAPDGTATVRATFRSLVMRQDSPYAHIYYDSRQPGVPVPQGAESFAALKGQGFTMQITPRGQITNLVGIEQMVAAMLKASRIPAGPQKAALEKSIRDLYSPHYMRNLMEKASPLYPAGRVGVGSRWTSAQSLVKPFPMTVGVTYQIVGLRHGTADIRFTSTIHGDPSQSVYHLPGQSVSVQIGGTQTGTMKIDTATGWQRDVNFEQYIAGHIRVNAAGQPQPLSWPLTIYSVGRMTTTP